MRKYEVLYITDTFVPRWVIKRNGRPLDMGYNQRGPNISEAEAHIITFALNAVANGWSLGKVPPLGGSFTHADQMIADYFESYDGPTEGVAS